MNHIEGQVAKARLVIEAMRRLLSRHVGGVAVQGNRIRIEQTSKHLMPMSARPIRASWCPTLPTGEPEYVALGGEDATVNVWDVAGGCSAALLSVAFPDSRQVTTGDVV